MHVCYIYALEKRTLILQRHREDSVDMVERERERESDRCIRSPKTTKTKLLYYFYFEL